MEKVVVQNLGLIVTERCNLNCAHCLRGKCSNKVMSDEVIEKTLSQFSAIGNLAICGGEPTFAISQMEKIFSYIIDNKILVDQVTLVINGTQYSEDFLKILEYIEEYVNYKKLAKSLTTFTISWDKFHHTEVERLNLLEQYKENIEKYAQTKFFAGFQRLFGKLIREGNALNLDSNWTSPLKPMKPFVSYAKPVTKLFSKEKGVCNVGPIVTVNVDGIITECDASLDNQRLLYNYGNILNDSVEEVFLQKRKALVVNQYKWKHLCDKEIRKYYRDEE